MDRPLLARRYGVRDVAVRFTYRAALFAATLAVCVGVLAGCAGPKWVTLRDVPHNPLADSLNLLSRGGPKPTERTLVFLRRYNLEGDLHDSPREIVHKVQNVINKEPSPEAMYAAAEVSYIGGARSQATMNSKQAFDLYGTSVIYSYAYLFHPQVAAGTETALQYRSYDPHFRGACDLYNASLEAELRAIKKQGKLKPGETFDVEVNGDQWDVTVEPRNVPWPAHDIEKFEFVSDYEIHGLQNVFHTYGLGVPLIAVRKEFSRTDPTEKHYAPGLSFPVTAFIRCLPDEPTQLIPGTQAANGMSPVVRVGNMVGAAAKAPSADGKRHHRAVLELYDPLQSTEVAVDGHPVPLESDLTTPLAYSLNDPSFAELDQPTAGLLFPSRIKKLTGIYMLEPYQPGKIPVLMVHGLWSSPITWMEMFNDLRGDPQLRSQYQFWFYLYPTGQPFWNSATQLRELLADVRNTFDPRRQEAALDQMVLVGHSMGGLISNMQIVNSRDDFWRIVSDKPFQQVKTDEKTRMALDRTFYFESSPSVRRIITIGTPHRGSNFANDFTRYLGDRLISLPEKMTARFAMLRLQNPNYFTNTSMLDAATSLDSLSPEAPVLPVILAAQRPPWIKYHNIVGRLPKDDWQVRLFGDGDGVVPYESAHLAQADTEIEVPAEHSEVHRHPETILQVRQILAEHLREVRTEYPEIGPPVVQQPVQQIAARP